MCDRLLQLHGERQRHVGGGLGGQSAPDAVFRDLREGGGSAAIGRGGSVGGRRGGSVGGGRGGVAV